MIKIDYQKKIKNILKDEHIWGNNTWACDVNKVSTDSFQSLKEKINPEDNISKTDLSRLKIVSQNMEGSKSTAISLVAIVVSFTIGAVELLSNLVTGSGLELYYLLLSLLFVFFIVFGIKSKEEDKKNLKLKCIQQIIDELQDEIN